MEKLMRQKVGLKINEVVSAPMVFENQVSVLITRQRTCMFSFLQYLPSIAIHIDIHVNLKRL